MIVGCGSIVEIRNKMASCQDKRVFRIIDRFMFRENEINTKRQNVPNDSVEFSFCIMELHGLVSECTKEILSLPKQADLLFCDQCGGILLQHKIVSDMVCHNCGLSKHIIIQEQYDFSTSSRFNGKPVHNYRIQENFNQTLTDICAIGKRKLKPDDTKRVMDLCYKEFGKRKNVSNHEVFQVLKKNKLQQYYKMKYLIASWIRGAREIQISSSELNEIRDRYSIYSRHFMDFQYHNNYGDVSKRGKWRLLWPVKFIMRKMFEKIGREDLLNVIGDISVRKNKVRYEDQWYELEKFIKKSIPDWKG